jgi:hypothetical protein
MKIEEKKSELIGRGGFYRCPVIKVDSNTKKTSKGNFFEAHTQAFGKRNH